MYQIKILTNKEFDAIAKSDRRYVNVNGDNLGFADPVRGTAFVRLSAYPDLNRYLVDHEFNHLLEDKGTDEDEYGIRHKKGKKFFKEMFLPATMPFVAPFVNKSKNPLSEGFSNIMFPFSPGGTGLEGGSGGKEFVEPQQPDQSAYAMSQFMQPSQGSGNADITTATAKLPDSVSSSMNGGQNGSGLYGNNQSGALPQDFMERIKGFFSGRIPF